jgi:hypothetical protein
MVLSLIGNMPGEKATITQMAGDPQNKLACDGQSVAIPPQQAQA